ncbi:(ZYRO0C13266g) [Zygosaccharomyces parabailii]|nr:(ZYRO0C13266g) [Zygosaccharomyces parabailii]CDH12151.1 uncharacterized protein ZBAI_03937 [Zygosaccharomyces bailii ISA1307]
MDPVCYIASNILDPTIETWCSEKKSQTGYYSEGTSTNYWFIAPYEEINQNKKNSDLGNICASVKVASISTGENLEVLFQRVDNFKSTTSSKLDRQETFPDTVARIVTNAGNSCRMPKPLLHNSGLLDSALVSAREFWKEQEILPSKGFDDFIIAAFKDFWKNQDCASWSETYDPILEVALEFWESYAATNDLPEILTEKHEKYSSCDYAVIDVEMGDEDLSLQAVSINVTERLDSDLETEVEEYVHSTTVEELRKAPANVRQERDKLAWENVGLMDKNWMLNEKIARESIQLKVADDVVDHNANLGWIYEQLKKLQKLLKKTTQNKIQENYFKEFIKTNFFFAYTKIELTEHLGKLAAATKEHMRILSSNLGLKGNTTCVTKKERNILNDFIFLKNEQLQSGTTDPNTENSIRSESDHLRRRKSFSKEQEQIFI